MGCTYLYQGQQFKTKEALVSFLNKGEEDYSPSFDYKIKPEEYFNNTDKIVAKILTNEPIEDIEDVLDASLLLIKFSDNKLLEGFEYTSTFRKYYDAKFKYQSGYTEDFKSRLASIGTEEELKNPKSLSKEKRKKYNEYNRYLRMVKAEVFSDVVMNRKNEEKNIEVKTLFDKIVEFFKNLFSNKVQSIELFEQLADTIINSAKQKIIYTDIKFPDNNYKAINFNEVVSKSDIGNYVISNLDNTGFLLTGSLSYSPFGNIYRNPDNMLHDIDMVSNKSRDESVEIIMKTYPNSEIIYDISKWMVTFIIPQKGSVIKNIQRKGGEKSLVKSYEVGKDNVKVGDFTLDYDVNEFGEVTTREEIKVGEEATFVDVFYDQKNNVKTTNYNYNGKNVKLNDPVEGFKAKISLSREKDIIDLLKFGKEDDADYSPSFDSVKPGVEGLFNDNPELSSIGTKEEYSQYLNSIFPDSKVKDIVYHSSKNKFDNF